MAEMNKMSMAQAIREGRRSNDPVKRAAFHRAIELGETESLTALAVVQEENKRDLSRRLDQAIALTGRVKELFDKFRRAEITEIFDPKDLN